MAQIANKTKPLKATRKDRTRIVNALARLLAEIARQEARKATN